MGSCYRGRVARDSSTPRNEYPSEMCFLFSFLLPFFLYIMVESRAARATRAMEKYCLPLLEEKYMYTYALSYLNASRVTPVSHACFFSLRVRVVDRARLRLCDRTREQSFTERKRAATEMETKQEERKRIKRGKKGREKLAEIATKADKRMGEERNRQTNS